MHIAFGILSKILPLSLASLLESRGSNFPIWKPTHSKTKETKLESPVKIADEKIQTMIKEIDNSKKKIAALEYTVQLQRQGYVTDV